MSLYRIVLHSIKHMGARVLVVTQFFMSHSMRPAMTNGSILIQLFLCILQVLGGIYGGNISGITAQHLEWVSSHFACSSFAQFTLHVFGYFQITIMKFCVSFLIKFPYLASGSSEDTSNSSGNSIFVAGTIWPLRCKLSFACHLDC